MYDQVIKDDKIAQYIDVTKWKVYQLWSSWMFYFFNLLFFINVDMLVNLVSQIYYKYFCLKKESMVRVP